ncbi:MAG TPA: ATP-binding protein [Roseiarcus sp.]|nr:ATP-binding protein [Roseiarcus sp.]
MNLRPPVIETNEADAFGDAMRLLNALPQPVMAIDADGHIREVNIAAENFFDMGRASLQRSNLADLLPFGSPVLELVRETMSAEAPINGYKLEVSSPRVAQARSVDAFVAPLPQTGGGVVLMLQERSIAEKMDRQLTHRGAARSVTALGAMLAHEIKNPLSGIRGAAQLLESAVSDDDRALTRLICDETDRIVKLVDRMESFSDERPGSRESLNIHAVLDHVRQVAVAGFARHIRFQEIYDPSLPHVFGSRDQLIQVFLNLVKNAAEAIDQEGIDGEIALSTAYRPGVRLKTRAAAEPMSLPLEVCIRDNGPGVPADIATHLFDPFVTTKSTGTGLGLALVAKVIGDHGGVVEFESLPRRTTFRILLPLDTPRAARASDVSEDMR